jgi:zinc transport system permease protein
VLELLDTIPIEIRPYVTAVFTSISCGIIGSYIVIRRMAFISGGITHASFGGVGLAYLLSFNPVLGALLVGLASALSIEYVTRKEILRNDSAIAMLWSVGMALGILFIYVSPGRAPNLISYLFGSILTVSHLELILLAVLSVAIVIFVWYFYHTILFISFDTLFAQSRKYPIGIFNSILISLIALTIVLNIRVVGIILVLSMLTIPQNIVLLYTKNLGKIMIWSVLVSVAGTSIGIMISAIRDIPTGVLIILVLFGMYLLARFERYFANRINAPT